MEMVSAPHHTDENRQRQARTGIEHVSQLFLQEERIVVECSKNSKSSREILRWDAIASL